MKFLALLLALIPLIIFTPIIFLIASTPVYAATAVDLGTADSFAVLAGSGITNTGTTTITGDVGTFPTTTETGFGSVTVTGTNHAGDATTQGAKSALVTAYNYAADQTTTSTISADLGSQTLTPGVYTSDSTIGLTGTVTLDGGGDPNAVFIFKAGSALTTATGSNVSLTNSTQSCNVFWQIGSDATLGTSSTFRGTLIALTSITVTTSVTVDGRILARNGAVTLDTNTITKPTCTSPTPTPTASPTPTAAPTATPTVSSVSGSSSSSSSSGGSPCTSSGVSSIPQIIETKRVSPTSIFVSWGPYEGLNDFDIQYGFQKENYQFSTKVSGFSTTINNLPVNQPIWIQVAATDNCVVGSFGTPVFSGETQIVNNSKVPRFPNTGMNPTKTHKFLSK